LQPSLTSRVQSGVVWNSISVSSTYLLGLVRSVILARLLLAEDFGLFGMALTVVAGLGALTSIGLDLSVIKTKFKSDLEVAKHLDTLWTVDLIRRVLIALLMLVIARPAAKFYGEARVYQLLLVLSLLPVVQGFQNIGLLMHRKDVNFKRIVFLELLTNLLTAIATIALVLWTHSVWALVLSQLISAFIGVALSYLFHPYRPHPQLDNNSLRLVLDFGKYAFLLSVLGYVMSMADNVLIGKLYSAAILGTYVIAYNLAVLPLHGVGMAIVNVTFPAYAEIAGGDVTGGELKRLERAFVRVFAASSTLLTLTTALLLLLGDEIVVFLYGSKWVAAGIILRILALLVFFKGHAILVSPLIISMRGIAPDAKIKLIEATIFLILLYPLTNRYGVRGAAWAGAAAFFVVMINRLRIAASLLPNVAGMLVRTVLSAAIACALGITAGTFAIASIESVVGRLFLGSAVIAAVVGSVMPIMSPELRTELRRLFSSVQQVQNGDR